MEIPADIGEIERAALVFDDGRTGRVDRGLLQQLRRKIHQPAIIGVRLVELEHRELGIVLRRDSLRCGNCD